MTTLRELIETHCDGMTDYEAIAAALNATTTVDNPQTEPYAVPDPPTLEDVLAVVPSAERVKIRALSGYVDDVRRAIDTQNALYMATLIEDALTAAAISAQTAGALAAMLAPTEVETTQPATIAGPSLAAAAGLPHVTAAQVQAALNA